MTIAAPNSPPPRLPGIVAISHEIARLRPQDAQSSDEGRAFIDALRRSFPETGEIVADIGHKLRHGIAAGELCTRGDPEARFSRIHKASPETGGLSVDVVSLEGAARAHRHPHGEITLGFPASAEDPPTCRFDGHAPGWVWMPPGSAHVPTVIGGRMVLLYWLPLGAVEWITP